MTEQEIIQIVQTWLNNNFQKTKVSQLATASSLTGLYVLGFLANGSVKAPIELLKGNAGKSVELRNNNGELQWRVEGGTWAKLYDQDDLRGKPFAYENFTQEQLDLLAESIGDGLEFSSNTTHIQYRLKGGTWIDVVALELLKGDKGDKGDTGSNIELQKTTTHVQWRVVGGSWANLIPLSDLKGDKGDNISLQKTATHIQWRLGTGTWVNLVALSELKGDTGANIELQKSATHVQWRVQGSGTWNNLIPIDDLKVKGDTGANIELQKSTTHVQWRVVGSPTWINLIPLADLKGAKGDAPVKGVDYFDGKNPVLNIGTITTVASNAQADATVVADGVDTEGKPKFKLNLWLPKGVDGEGAGDMRESIYDPQGKNTDIFGYVDNKVKTDVPVNAKFTDTTYSEITEAEINTGTASTLRTITARRVTFILSKAQTLINSAISALTKSSVGLGNVDNVKQIPLSEKGANNGVAELDSAGKVPANQLPSYVDDVMEFASLQNFPATGESGKIYIAINRNLAYRWTGTGYAEISQGIALGETSTTAYRGDRGKTAYDHSQTAHAPSNAQKNSDITKAEIEAKLTGKITTHTHDYMSINDWVEVADEPPANADPNKIYYTVE